MGLVSQDERDYRRRLGKVIVQLRERHRMSQATLAERIHRSEAAVSRWETGKATPSAFDVREIAQIFDLPPDTLSVLIYPPAVYGPEMQRVFVSIEAHLAATKSRADLGGRPTGIAPKLQHRPAHSGGA